MATNKPQPTETESVEKPQTTEEDITSQPGALQAVRPSEAVEPLDADAEYVEYKGKATIRRITQSDWEKARVKGQGEVVWDKSNDFQVPLSDLNSAALAVIRRDGAFAIPEGK